MARTEFITRGDAPESAQLAPGVALRILVTGQLGSKGLTTATATFRPGAELPYHRHQFSEAVTVVRGRAEILVEGRRYQLRTYDAMHLPAGTAHFVRNPSPDEPAVLLSAFASETPTRELVEDRFAAAERGETDGSCPEHLTRFEKADAYELNTGVVMRDLFAGRLGARGICGGHAVFRPGSFLPCHTHDFDESISIVEGRAVCQVAGNEYELSGVDTACVPKGRPHRFLNRSSELMVMIWVYAGDEPDRVIVDQSECEPR